ncbi:uncharacterized protein LOC26530017, partial [Drosophila willistoni]
YPFILLVLCCVLWSPIQAQSEREYCERIYRNCLFHTPRLGRFDETINSYNRYCDRESRGRWTYVTRCQMEKATCLLTLTRCADISCHNIANVLDLV